MEKLITQIIKAFTTQKKASTQQAERYQAYVQRIREALENN